MTLPTLELQEAFTTGPAADVPAWETIASSYTPRVSGLRSFTARQGRSSDLDRDAAGTFEAVVDVTNRDLDPAHAASPHDPYVTPNRAIRLAIGYVAEVLHDHPSSYWRLGEYTPTSQVYKDEQQNYVAAGVNTPTTWVTGLLTGNKSVVFTAANSEYIAVDDNGYYRFTTDLTVEAWVYPYTVHDGGIFTTYKTPGFTPTYQVFLDNNVPYFRLYDAGGTAYDCVGPGALSTLAWHHVVATFTDEDMRLYVDGVQVATNLNIGASIRWGAGGSFIGRTESPGFYFDGGVDEVAVYNHALTADRIAAHYAAATTGIGGYVHTGYVDAHNVSYRGNNDATVSILATDRFKLLARAKLTGFAARPIEDAGTRIVYALAHVGLYWRTYIHTAAAILMAEDISDRKTLDALLEIVDTEGPGARLFVDKDGVLVFVSRRAINEDPEYTASQATFSDSGAGGVIPYSTIVFENSDTLLFNTAEISHPTFDPITVADATSVGANGVMTHERTVRDASPAAQNATAEAVVARYKDPHTRVLSVTVPTSRTTASYPYGLYDIVLNLRLGARVTVERTLPPGGGDPITQECFIVSATHTCDAPSQNWTTTFGFALAPDVDSYALWDVDVWDTGTWAY